LLISDVSAGQYIVATIISESQRGALPQIQFVQVSEEHCPPTVFSPVHSCCGGAFTCNHYVDDGKPRQVFHAAAHYSLIGAILIDILASSVTGLNPQTNFLSPRSSSARYGPLCPEAILHSENNLLTLTNPVELVAY